MTPARRTALLFALFFLLLSPALRAQQAGHAEPETTGTTTSSMDAPDTNRDLESYQHSPSVQWLARHLGLSTAATARYCEDLNAGVLILAVLYFLIRYVPGMLRAKRAGIDHDLVRARQATVDAQARITRVEGRLASLQGEIAELRREAAASGQREQARIEAALRAERERIEHAAEAEIAALEGASERGLRRYAAALAVDRAAERVRVTPEGDQALVDEFLQGLGRVLGKEQN